MVGVIANPISKGSKSRCAKVRFVIFLQDTNLIEILTY
jgi:hypothetical protein